MNQFMEECGDAVGVGSMDFALHSNWLDDLLNDDVSHPYSINYIDLSFSTNNEIIDLVRANYEAYNKEKNRHPTPPASLTLLPDPWELARPWFIMSKKFGSDEKTRHGYWKENGTEFTAIPADQLQFLQPPAQRSRRPVYIGFKRILEFYMNDGTKTEWRTSEFAMIHQSDDGLFFLKVCSRISFRTKFSTVTSRHSGSGSFTPGSSGIPCSHLYASGKDFSFGHSY